MNNSKSPACLLEAFRIFDKDDTGHILVWDFQIVQNCSKRICVQVSDLKIMMTKMGGETFSEEEFETMVKIGDQCKMFNHHHQYFQYSLNFEIPVFHFQIQDVEEVDSDGRIDYARFVKIISRKKK